MTSQAMRGVVLSKESGRLQGRAIKETKDFERGGKGDLGGRESGREGGGAEGEGGGSASIGAPPARVQSDPRRLAAIGRKIGRPAGSSSDGRARHGEQAVAGRGTWFWRLGSALALRRASAIAQPAA